MNITSFEGNPVTKIVALFFATIWSFCKVVIQKHQPRGTKLSEWYFCWIELLCLAWFLQIAKKLCSRSPKEKMHARCVFSFSSQYCRTRKWSIDALRILDICPLLICCVFYERFLTVDAVVKKRFMNNKARHIFAASFASQVRDTVVWRDKKSWICEHQC